jgi:hypothetical protein
MKEEGKIFRGFKAHTAVLINYCTNSINYSKNTCDSVSEFNIKSTVQYMHSGNPVCTSLSLFRKLVKCVLI